MGLNIKAARELKGLEQQELGEMLSPVVTQQYVSKWETGFSQPRQNTLNQIAKVTGVKVGDLLDMQGRIYERWKKSLDEPLGLEVESPEKTAEPGQFTEEDFRRFVREETEKLLRGYLSNDLAPWRIQTPLKGRSLSLPLFPRGDGAFPGRVSSPLRSILPSRTRRAISTGRKSAAGNITPKLSRIGPGPKQPEMIFPAVFRPG